MVDLKHGRWAYSNGCRCEQCRDDWRIYCAERRAARAARAVPAGKHGRITTYTNYGCRCPECKAVGAEYGKRRAR